MTMTLAVAIDEVETHLVLAGELTLALQGSGPMPSGFPKVQLDDEYMLVVRRLGHGLIEVERPTLPDHAPYFRTTAAAHAEGTEVIFRPERGRTGG